MLETCLCTFCKWWIILVFLVLLVLAALILPFGAVLPTSLICPVYWRDCDKAFQICVAIGERASPLTPAAVEDPARRGRPLNAES